MSKTLIVLEKSKIFVFSEPVKVSYLMNLTYVSHASSLLNNVLHSVSFLKMKREKY